jgi:Glycosyltransferase Family 4
VKVALLDHRASERSLSLAADLPDAHVVAAHAVRPIEALLRRRGFAGPLTHLPSAVATLAAGGFHVVHAFSVPDAVAALAWRRLSGAPVVLTCDEVLGRGNVADRRLRLASLQRATEGADALLAADEVVRASVRRWLALDARVLAPADHAQLYERLAG